MLLNKKSDFLYNLPSELIAQTPIEPRDFSRLMILDRKTGEVTHKNFFDIIDYLNPGDCLVINNSKVIPARIFGKNILTGGNAEFLLIKQMSCGVWEALAKPGKKAKIGTIYEFGDGILQAEILDNTNFDGKILKFNNTINFFEKLDEIGQMPLPPYIKKHLEEQERYQTIYAQDLGSAAAPTAGLHFTKDLLQKIKEKGVNIASLTLHVGLGTFRPVQVENIDEHVMHFESYTLDEKNAEIIIDSRKKGGKIICVGTTSCRTLEAVFQKFGQIQADSSSTNIFIRPGYKFGAIDALITNFHLPESTLIMLVSAFAGYENTMNTYKTAIENKYRFFSFGDAMLVV